MSPPGHILRNIQVWDRAFKGQSMFLLHNRVFLRFWRGVWSCSCAEHIIGYNFTYLLVCSLHTELHLFSKNCNFVFLPLKTVSCGLSPQGARLGCHRQQGATQPQKHGKAPQAPRNPNVHPPEHRRGMGLRSAAANGEKSYIDKASFLQLIKEWKNTKRVNCIQLSTSQ